MRCLNENLLTAGFLRLEDKGMVLFSLLKRFHGVRRCSGFRPMPAQ
jgi:hypothetical protein